MPILPSNKAIRRIQEMEVANPIIGTNYHLSWAKKRGMVWQLKAIDGRVCTMITPKSKRELTTDISTLRYINKQVVRIYNREKK